MSTCDQPRAPTLLTMTGILYLALNEDQPNPKVERLDQCRSRLRDVSRESGGNGKLSEYSRIPQDTYCRPESLP